MKLLLASSEQTAIVRKDDGLYVITPRKTERLEVADEEKHLLAARIKWGMRRIVGADDKPEPEWDGDKLPHMEQDRLPSGEWVYKVKE